MFRGLLEQVAERLQSRESESRSTFSMATQSSEASDESDNGRKRSKPPTDAEMLQRARDAHNHIQFNALAAGPNAGGPWKRVEVTDRFVLFLQDDRAKPASLETSTNLKLEKCPEVLCAGRLDACLEEIVAVLHPRGEAEHNAVMRALYSKRFLCGSVERGVPCVDMDEKPVYGDTENGEELVVKTSSFARSALFGTNEQWCYTDFYQRKAERDGFTISQRSLPCDEFVASRMVGAPTRVDQLHHLTAAYLIDLDPGGKGLRVVYNAMFLEQNAPAAPPSTDITKAQTRRLLALAGGVTKIPELIRCRRFGFQVPADLDAIQVANPHCPCCTRSLAPVKMSLAAAASAIARRSLSPLRMDNRRCYLCGYLVCATCWSAERMENMSGRVAAIVVCRRCQHCVDACNYTDISSDRAHGPARVVADSPESTTASLLVDFLADSLAQSPVDSPERSNVLAVVRTLLRHDQTSEDDKDNQGNCRAQQYEAEAIAMVDQFLRDELNLPLLEMCTLGNAERRSYTLDLPDDPETSVPRGPIPSNESSRLSAVKAAGLLLLADQLAPENPVPLESGPICRVDVRDLELVCHLASKTLGCSNAMISVMGASHEHILASTDPNFAGAAVPRDYTMCQHQLMSQDPLVLIHPEADVRLQAIETIKLMSLRSYIGFPVTAPSNDLENGQIAVGTLCCIDNKPHPELTRSQYATMQNLARTASMLVQQKGLQLQQKAAAAS
ncbi:hypothetical protein PRNP1_005168 [Phytophthora ramorum]